MKRNEMLIEADELLAKMGDPNLRIYDATILFFRKERELTSHEQYMQAHIPGAAFFDHQQFSDATQKYMYMALPEAEMKAQVGAIGISTESEVVFYTSDMMPSATRAWWLLHYAGHDNVRVLNGGLAAWQAAGGALSQGDETYLPAEYDAVFRPGVFADKDEVLAAMADGAVCTVNTLTQEVYAQGHIKDSSLLPCTDLLHEMRTFLANEQMAARLQEEIQYEKVITYCGGGIAATVNGMAHLMVGNENVAVYDGSMDEWGGEQLPMGTAVGG